MEEKKHDECDTDSLRLFMQHVQHGHKEPGGRWGNPRMTRPTTPRTAKNYHGILRAFFNWCVSDGLIPLSPMEKVSVPIDRPDCDPYFRQGWADSGADERNAGVVDS